MQARAAWHQTIRSLDRPVRRVTHAEFCCRVIIELLSFVLASDWTSLPAGAKNQVLAGNKAINPSKRTFFAQEKASSTTCTNKIHPFVTLSDLIRSSLVPKRNHESLASGAVSKQ